MSASKLTEQALHLDALCGSDWNINYSSYTGKWYVSAKGLDLTNGVFLSGVCIHRDTPEEALVAFMAELRDEGQGKQVIAVNGRHGRRHYRWNGAAFAEVPDSLLPWADGVPA